MNWVARYASGAGLAVTAAIVSKLSTPTSGVFPSHIHNSSKYPWDEGNPLISCVKCREHSSRIYRVLHLAIPPASD